MKPTLQILSHEQQAVQGEEPGVLRLANDADPLAPELSLEGISRIELHFPKFTDGRAFSQAFLLRRRRRFQGDIRAIGEVLVDQLVQMERTGFSSAVLREGVDPAPVRRQFERFQGFYQGDVQEAHPLFARPHGQTVTA